MLPDRVVTAHATLPPGHRELLLLRELEEMPCAEIAEVLDVGVETAARRAWRARDALVLRAREASTGEGVAWPDVRPAYRERLGVVPAPTDAATALRIAREQLAAA